MEEGKKTKGEENLRFHPKIDEKSRKIIERKKNKKRNSFMGDTLNSRNRFNENKFQNVVRRMSLDPDVVKMLNNSYHESRKDFYENKKNLKRGKSVCFIDTLNQTERKIKEMEDIYQNRMQLNSSLNRIEYDRSLNFLVDIVNKKKYKY